MCLKITGVAAVCHAAARYMRRTAAGTVTSVIIIRCNRNLYNIIIEEQIARCLFVQKQTLIYYIVFRRCQAVHGFQFGFHRARAEKACQQTYSGGDSGSDTPRERLVRRVLGRQIGRASCRERV